MINVKIIIGIWLSASLFPTYLFGSRECRLHFAMGVEEECD